MTNADLVVALRDVRTAYRLIMAFQKRCLDMVDLAAEQFRDKLFYQIINFTDVEFPRVTINPFDKWPTLMLPLYTSSFLYTGSDRKTPPTQGQWMLEVRLIMDSAAWSYTNGSPGQDFMAYQPVDKTESVISLLAWNCLETFPEGTSWRHIWTDSYWPTDEEVDQGSVTNGMDGKVQLYSVDARMESLATQEQVIAFTDRAKAAFRSKLGIDIPY